MATDVRTGSQPLEEVQRLTDALDRLEDGPEKELAEELVGAVVALYGEGLARIMEVLGDDAAQVSEVRERLAADGVVASLLLVHDLYPVPLETRVLEALASVRPYMESHGGNVALDRIEDGVAHLRLVGHCDGCPASLSTLELAIEDALAEHAPDLLGVEVEGLAQPKHASETPRRPAPVWLTLDQAGGVEPGTVRTVPVGGVDLIVANVAGSLLAYRSECPCCGAAMDEATLEGEILSCARCRHGFALAQAGRAVGSDDVYLEPVPMLRRSKGLELSVALAT
jgi:Fe-S cluster biogenesis protein NfuA/nitrite reductase/ring-hydroxylating ferredoxin subunit